MARSGARRHGNRSSTPAESTTSPVMSARTASGGNVLQALARGASGDAPCAGARPSPCRIRLATASPSSGTKMTMISSDASADTRPIIALSPAIATRTTAPPTSPPSSPPSEAVAMRARREPSGGGAGSRSSGSDMTDSGRGECRAKLRALARRAPDARSDGARCDPDPPCHGRTMPSDRSKLHSQRSRAINFQGDALRMGMNWTEEDLAKPQILIDSAYGMGHPGTFHFRPLIEEVSNGVFEAGGKPGVFTVSDICDGVAQAHAGMSYSLVSRDIMAAMIEIHALGHPHDGMVLISGNDKSVPAHLLAIARCDLPAIHLPGGTQLNGPEYVTSDQMWALGAAVERGELAREELERAQSIACPTCGACQFMGSASTGQVLAEALGLALPGSALIPVPLTRHLRYARMVGKQVLKLIEQDITPRKILTREAFENAIILHAAIGGSTNGLLHLPVIAREVGIDISIDDFDRIHRRVPVLANAKTTGMYPVEYLWYAGGVPAVMLEIADMLHLDCLTVTGKTVGENLEDVRRSTFFAETRGYLANVKVEKEEIIRPQSDAFGPEGGIAVLRGNLAP